MPSPPVIGLIAGAGELPLYFARQARSRGYAVQTAALRGAAPKKIEKASDETLWISIGQLGALVSFFKKRGVRRAVMHGKVQHAQLFKNLRLDWKALSLWRRLKDRSGESLLRAVAGELAQNGTRLEDGRRWMEGILAPRGWITRGQAGPEWKPSMDYGLRLARRIARFNIGQTLVVKKSAVVAVEAMEGTDEAILRAGKWAGGGTIAVKAASPRQDWRFDVPTVGLKTIRTLARVKARGIVLEAGKAFLLDRERTVAEAEKNGIFIYGA